MFEQTGLVILPGQLWQFVDGSFFVDRAVDHFLLLLGLDVEAIHRGDDDALTRANLVLDLLVDVESAFSRLSPAAAKTIEDAIFSGDYERVREAARIVSIYEGIARLGHRWPEEARFAAFTDFLRDVASELADPLSATLDDAEAAESIASHMMELMHRFDHALRVQDHWLRTFAGLAGTWEGWKEASQLQQAVNRFASLVKQMRAEPFSVTDMDDLISRLEKINAELELIYTRNQAAGAGGRDSSGGRHRSSPPPGSDSVLKEVEKALVFFGFARDAKPSHDEIKKRWRAACKTSHPDHHGGPSDAFLEVQQFWAVLSRRFPT
ncbi:MAG: DnaJ domain [Sphingomonadales bacterium]|nr:DnaJ domain [Sphingomonadales bacterium]